MLDPDYLERAGDMVAAVYGEIEAEMTAYLSRLLLDQDLDELGQRGQTAVNLLAQSAAPKLMAILEKARPEVSRAVAETVEDALRRSDAADARRLGGKLPEGAASSLPRQMELTARGIAAILERDNVEMTAAALALWNRCVTEAVAKANSGALTAEQAVHAAVRRMMREGCSWVQYRDSKTGRQTVANRVDVAVRRHVRTQLHQDGMRRTLGICEEAGVRLVEVSSHGGARPEHARWQGRVYSLDGDVTIGGVRYRDFYRETGYGKVDGLGGANCRHDFAPWIPGTPRMHEPDPPHPSGLPNDEVYALAQGQRRRERGIRDAKRDLAAAQLIADKDPSMANVAEVERAKTKLRGRQKGMRDFIAGANAKGKAPVLRRAPAREWAGDMPKVRNSDASRRTMGEFLDGAGVKRTLKARGVTKAEARAALTAELEARGMRPADFKMLSRSSQNEIMAVTSSRARRKETRALAAKASIGNIETPEAKAVLEDGKLLDSFGAKRRASIAASVEDAARSEDKTRRNAAKLFAKTLKESARFERTSSVTVPTYDPASKTVLIPMSYDPFDKVVIHEVVHLIDHQGTVPCGDGTGRRTRTTQYSSCSYSSKTGKISSLLTSDYNDLSSKAEELSTNIQTYVLTLAKEYNLDTTYKDVGFLSDLIDAASRGGSNLGYGHSFAEKDYWKKGLGQAIAAECLANYGGSAVSNAVEFNLIRELFPQTAAGLDELIEVMADGV